MELPAFAREERLEKFLSFDFKLGPPEVFCNFCQAALDSKSAPTPVTGMRFAVDSGCSLLVIDAEFSSVTAQEILQFDPTFCGAHLIMSNVPKVSIFYY